MRKPFRQILSKEVIDSLADIAIAILAVVILVAGLAGLGNLPITL